MNMKRLFFMGGLLVLFIFCYSTMNEHYDELARYQYVDDSNRKVIMEHLNADEINILIDRQYKPEEFMPYLGLTGFNIRYVPWYNDALEVKEMDPTQLIALVNLAVNHPMNYSSLSYYSYYDTEVFESYLKKESIYLKDFSLVLNPTKLNVKIGKNETLYRYVPKNLVELVDVPVVTESEKNEKIIVTEATNDAIQEVCQALKEASGQTCGNMIITKGYVSYSEQVEEYEEAILKLGTDKARVQVDYPGQSLYQLGTTLKLVLAKDEVAQAKGDILSPQHQWLKDHAKEYGFDLVNDRETPLEEFVLRYVGLQTSSLSNKGDDLQ